MLQQTTVGAVARRYDPFLRRFPTLRSLAIAREDSVLAAWSGLGYYARARNLRRAAIEILRRHRGVFPREPDVLRGLPGFGEYMSAAVPSLAFGLRIPAADANVTRVVSRLFAIAGTAGTRGHRERVLEAAGRLLPRTRPGDVTAALMDLGQSFCTARNPDCAACPLAAFCEARRRGRPEEFPSRAPKRAPVVMAMASAIVRRNGRAFLVRRAGGYLEGMWEFPSGPPRERDRDGARRGLSRTLAALGLRRRGEALATVRHTVVHRRLAVEVFRASGAPRVPAQATARWFTPRELERAAIPTLTRKIARAAGFL